MMRVLFITTVLPSRIQHGGDLWSQTIIASLRRCGAEVEILGYERRGSLRGAGETGAGEHLIETRTAPFRSAFWALKSFGRRAFTVQKWMGATYRTRLKKLIQSCSWDLVVVDHAQMGWTLGFIKDIPIIYLAHHAEQALYSRLAASSRSLRKSIYRREARLLGRAETLLVKTAYETWCISEHDAAKLRNLTIGSVRKLPPLACERGALSPFMFAGPQVAMLGNWRWLPNRHALHWFLEFVEPLLPSAWTIEIGGNVDVPDWPVPDRVSFCGAIADGHKFLRRAERVAVPSLAAEGANLKLLDAIASARPVVASAAAVRLVGDVPSDVLSADSAEEFAAALISISLDDRSGRSAWMQAREGKLDEVVTAALRKLRTPE